MGILNSVFHVHEYGIMDERGYQQCIHCKKAFYIGLPPVNPDWSILERIEFLGRKGKVIKITFVQQCKNSGDLKIFSVKS